MTSDRKFGVEKKGLRDLKEITAQAKARKDTFRANKLTERKPFYVLDHLVKERFPSFVDAVRNPKPETQCPKQNFET